MEIRTLRYFLAVAREENMTRAADDPLARKETFSPGDLKSLPLFCSEQSWRREIADWAGDSFESFLLEGSFRLSYNGSVFARAHAWKPKCIWYGKSISPLPPSRHSSWNR